MVCSIPYWSPLSQRPCRMRLSRFTDIGLRALMYLGARGDRTSARQVAEAYDVSKDHVIKSLQALAGLGLVESTPGRGGGFRLSCDPSDVRLGDLIRDLEPSMALAECFQAHSTCPLTPSCGLAGALSDAERAFIDALNRRSLADVIRANRAQLVQLEVARR